MFVKTVSTISGINPIKFDETSGSFYWILNTGSSAVYASTEDSFSAGDDGVVSLGPKELRRLETNNDIIYILGEGQVEIHNQRDGICSFKEAPTSSGGGGTVDAYTKTESDARYAQKTDIPESLPANGGNADTVGGKSPSDFLPFQTSAPEYTGDIKDISKMGTYSCYKEDCTNLPDILIWAYVTMMQFQDAGYKTFLCIELNPLSANQHCRNIYIAREYDVDDSGNMVWYRACDGGISETMSDWGTQTISDANNAPYGFCNTSPDSENNPDTFWTTILTVGANANSSYKQQFAFPWSEGKAVRYRMQDNEKWGSWKDIYTSDNKTYVTGIFNLTSSSTSQTIDIPLAFDPVMVLLFKQSSTIVVPKQFMLEMIDPSKYSIKIGVVDSTDLQLTTGFQASFLTVEGTGMAVRYIAYK